MCTRPLSHTHSATSKTLTGFSLLLTLCHTPSQARGHAFALSNDTDSTNPSEYAAGRRPTHTLSPYILTREGGAGPFLAISMKGGDRSPYSLTQFLLQLFRADAPLSELALRDAIAAPRFRDVTPAWPTPWQPVGSPSKEPAPPHSIEFDEPPATELSRELLVRGFALQSPAASSKFADSAFAIIHALMWLPASSPTLSKTDYGGLTWAVATDSARKPGLALTVNPMHAGKAAMSEAAIAVDTVGKRQLAHSSLGGSLIGGGLGAGARPNLTVVLQWHTGRIPVSMTDPFNPWTTARATWDNARIRPVDLWRSKGTNTSISPKVAAKRLMRMSNTLPIRTFLLYEHGAWDAPKHPGKYRALLPEQMLEPYGFPLGRLPVASPSRVISALSENRLGTVMWMHRHGLGRHAPYTVSGETFIRALCNESTSPVPASASAPVACTLLEPPLDGRLAMLGLPEYPLFIKLDKSMYGEGTHLVSSAADKKSWARVRAAIGDQWGSGLVVQEALIGATEVTVNFAAIHGKLVDSTCFRFTHTSELYVKGTNSSTRAAGGKQPCALSTESPRVRALVEAILQRSVYTGIGCVQLKEVLKEGSQHAPRFGKESSPPSHHRSALEPMVVEVNPRICGSLGFSAQDTVRLLTAWWTHGGYAGG